MVLTFDFLLHSNHHLPETAIHPFPFPLNSFVDEIFRIQVDLCFLMCMLISIVPGPVSTGLVLSGRYKKRHPVPDCQDGYLIRVC